MQTITIDDDTVFDIDLLVDHAERTLAYGDLPVDAIEQGYLDEAIAKVRGWLDAAWPNVCPPQT